MKVFLSLNPKKDIFDQIKMAKKIGYDGVEIVLEEKVGETVKKKKEKVKKFLKKKKLDFCFHLPNWLNVLRAEDVKEILNLKKIVEYFNSFGVLHLDINTTEEIKKLKKIPRELKENLYYENLLQSSSLLKKIFKLDLNFTIDISHFLIHNSFLDFKKFLKENKRKVKHFHLSDGNGIFHSHLPLGKGVYPIKNIVEFLLENFKDRTITLEIFDTSIPEIEFEISYEIINDILKNYKKTKK